MTRDDKDNDGTSGSFTLTVSQQELELILYALELDCEGAPALHDRLAEEYSRILQKR